MCWKMFFPLRLQLKLFLIHVILNTTASNITSIQAATCWASGRWARQLQVYLWVFKVDHFLPGHITAVTHAEQLTRSWAGYVQDKRSAGKNALPTDQSDQSVLLESCITVGKRSRGAQSADDKSLRRKSELTDWQTFIEQFSEGWFICVTFSNRLLQRMNEAPKRFPVWTEKYQS